MNSKILFVDDELSVTDGLRRLLRRQRQYWHMHFVNSAQEAISAMESDHYDLLVSDMRMPNMNGAELLRHARSHFPTTLRVILSGYSDSKLELESTKTAHLFLIKPINQENLIQAISRLLKLRQQLTGSQLDSYIASLDAPPSLPQLYHKLIDHINTEEYSTRSIGELISQDIGMTSKILHLANSAFFGLARDIESIFDAVNFLGVNVIRDLSLTIDLFKSCKAHSGDPVAIDQLWYHSQEIAALARQLAIHHQLDQTIVDAAFTGGMVHHIGHLIMLQQNPASYQNIHRQFDFNDDEIIDSEIEHYGVSHDLLGAHLLELWGLPQSIIACALYHHQPQALDFNKLQAPQLIYIASHFSDLLSATKPDLPERLLTMAQEHDWQSIDTRKLGVHK